MTATSLPSGDQGVPGTVSTDPASVRVGQVYLDVRHRRLHWLNATAPALHREGIPFIPADLARQRLLTLAGDPVTAKQLPLLAAWRQGLPVEAHFLLPRATDPAWQVGWNATPWRDESGRLLGILGTVLVGPPGPDWQGLAELAHDLRTPLQSLRLLCALLEKAPQTDPGVVKQLEAVRSASERAVAIALELLERCRGPASPHRKTGPTWFAVAPFLAQLVQEQATAAQHKGLHLTAELSALDGWEIHIDRGRFGRVLANLLANAVRYTAHGQVELTASWQEKDGQHWLLLGVVDSGPGIAAEEQESIFHPFERGRAGREGDSTGSGLGLTIVDRLIAELGLRLEVFSQFGRGSTFDLLIPATMLRRKED